MSNTSAKGPRRAPAARCGAITLRVAIDGPAWLRAACEAVVRIADALAKTNAPATLAQAQNVAITPAFSRRTPMGQTLALARRAAVLAFEKSAGTGTPRKDRIRAACVEHYRTTGKPMSERSLLLWLAIARKAGGAASCSIDTFLDGKCTPHRRKPKTRTPRK